MFKKILIPVDGSISAEKLIEWTGTIAKRIGAEVVLLAVPDPVEWIPWPSAAAWTDQGDKDSIAAGIDPYPPGPHKHSMREFQDQVMVRAVENALSYLGQRAKLLEASGVKTAVEVRKGTPSTIIGEVATATGSDLIVMSTRRTSALARGVLGSVTDRVIRTSALPVMIAQPDYVKSEAGRGGAITKIVVPMDGSELSETAASPAIALAKTLAARIVFLRSIESGPAAVEPDTGYRDEVAQYLGQFVEMAESDGLTVNARVVTGPASARILGETENEPGAIVVMCSQGRGGFKRFLLGSVTDKVVRSSGVPVVVIPPKS